MIISAWWGGWGGKDCEFSILFIFQEDGEFAGPYYINTK